LNSITRTRGLRCAMALAVTTAVVLVPVSAQATTGIATDSAPSSFTSSPSADGVPAKADDRSDPEAEARRDLNQQGVEQVITGEAKVEDRNGSKAVKVAPGQWAQYGLQDSDQILSFLVDFGTKIDPRFPASPAGPTHNAIPEPDRAVDNSTYWTDTFDREHYLDMFFDADGESLKSVYGEMSSGRYTVDGDVSDWVTVPFNSASYGETESQADMTRFVQDTANAWYDAQIAAGKTPAEIDAYLATFDQWDRYDFDKDGDFDEADGYIDHFQAIHAGEGEEAGGGAQGEDAIWSHRWYAYSTQIGRSGPEQNKAGGVQLGDTGMWIGDYTTEPENGGLGVFTHEFGHDLGLPDYYDTAGGDNGTGFWTLMSGGSWLNHGTVDIGSTPGYMGPKEKLDLGWLDYTVADKSGTYKLGQADLDGAKTPQAIVVNLPDKRVATKYNTPHSGAAEWWSGSGDSLNNSMTRDVDLTGKTSATASAWLDYKIEQDYDYLYVEASTDGGANWTRVDEIGGASNGWVQKSWDLSPFAGQKAKFRFSYVTDGGLAYKGAFIDDITFTADGASVLSDDVEAGTNGWVADGFSIMSGSTDKTYQRFYMAENRVYSGYDKTLQTGPYNFGWANTRPDWVERFPYQNGMLVWYVDGSFADNNTSAHPGGGQSLPVDARPAPVKFPTGQLLGNRRQPWDATFGQEKTDKVTFHRNGVPVTINKQAAIPTFDDTDPNKYWTADNPWNSVKVAGSGTKITVAKTTKGGTEMDLKITVPKK